MYVHPVHTLIFSKEIGKGLRLSPQPVGAVNMFFEWDESKRQSNLAKHRIDFQDALRIFEGPVFERANRKHGEDRVCAIGLIEGVEIVVVYVIRGKHRRIISARRAHRDERQDYENHLTDTIYRRH
jgi:uncharacterized protein